jgi:hypothetical protein
MGTGGGEFIFKTRAEQLLEWLYQQHRHRNLTNQEWQQVKRCEHAIYERVRRQQIEEADREMVA